MVLFNLHMKFAEFVFIDLAIQVIPPFANRCCKLDGHLGIY